MNEMKIVLLRFVVLALLLNMGTVAFFFMLDDWGLMEWEMLYVVPLGIANGIVLFVLNLKMESVKKFCKKICFEIARECN